MSNCRGCGKSKTNCCCIKNYRGEMGPQGDRGPRGPQGVPGQDAEIIMTAVNSDTEQDIGAIGQTLITEMIIPVVAGTYAVWFDASIEGSGEGTYGICANSIFQDFDRLLPGAPGSICAVNGEVIIAAPTNITVEAIVTSASITVKRSSLIVQKIA